jgi:membrane-bound lytic murein transglycosylase MltF
MIIRDNNALRALLAGMLLSSLAACGGSPGDGQQAPVRDIDSLVRSLPDDALLESPHFLEELPDEFTGLWAPWNGDLDGIVERRALRVLVPFGGYQYYYVGGRPRGAIVELLQKLESHLNDGLPGARQQLYVVPIPVSRDRLIRYLLEGHADLIAADLTVTPAREQDLRFSSPLLTDVSEVVVTGPAAAALESLDDLAGNVIVVRQSSSYYEHLQALVADFEERDLKPPKLHLADELLEAEDLLEMVDVGTIAITVMDDYKAEYWSAVFPNITVRDDLVINENGVIAWAMPKQSEKLAASVEDFLRKNGRGTLVGNDTFNRYLADASKVRCVMTPEALEQRNEMARLMQVYADEYQFDWLMLAAQGYQESRLNQSRRSAAGAVGVMQVKPSTAADKNINVPDINIPENNIHAGAKYMRFIADRYFSEGMDDINRWFFSLAAYNAGPAKVARLRSEAEKNGLDPNRWFDNVEIIAARRIGRETIGYVANIYKHYVGYKMAMIRLQEEVSRHGGELKGCQAG